MNLPELPAGTRYTSAVIYVTRGDRSVIVGRYDGDEKWTATEYSKPDRDPWGVPLWTATADDLDSIIQQATEWLEQA